MAGERRADEIRNLRSFAEAFRRTAARAPERDDSCVALLGFADGSTASIEYLAAADPGLPKERFEVSGDGLTARCENFLHGRRNLDDTIARLVRYAEAGADVVYAPGLPDLDAVRAICEAVPTPVNVLVVGPLTQHSVADFAAAGAARLSLGSMLARHTMAYLFSAAAEMKDSGTFGFASVFAGRDQLDQFMC